MISGGIEDKKRTHTDRTLDSIRPICTLRVPFNDMLW